jgi:KaiC/GvpD/RAD55 family RecA-like ATPase
MNIKDINDLMDIKDIKNIPINIIGLSEILRENGIILPPTRSRSMDDLKGLILLIKGKPGTGKSTLALQIVNCIIDFINQKPYDLIFSKSKIYYKSLDQKTENIHDKFVKIAGKRKMRNWNRIICNSMLSENSEKPYAEISPLIQIIDTISEIDEAKICYPLIVIDGLNILPGEERHFMNIPKIIDVLRKKSLLSVIVYEPNESEENYLEYIADMSIELKSETIKNPVDYTLNFLRLPKSRYQYAALGWHQYKFRENGLEIYQSIHYQIHRSNYMADELSSSTKPLSEVLSHLNDRKLPAIRLKKESIIELCLNNIFPDSSTVLLGARATFKSLLSIDFLTAGARQNQLGLLLSLIDNKDSIHQSIKVCPSQELQICIESGCKKKCYNHIFHFHQRPGCIATPEFFHFLNQRINFIEKEKINRMKNEIELLKKNILNFKKSIIGNYKENDEFNRMLEKYNKRIFEYKNMDKQISRICFWDLAQFEYRFPLLYHDPMFLPGFMDYCKKHNMASLIMGSGNSSLSKAAAATADNVIFCWRDRIDNEKTQNKIITGENWLNKYNSKDFAQTPELLILYVDRTQGKLGSEGKALYCFEIDSNTGMLKLDGIRNFQKKYRLFQTDMLKYAEKRLESIDKMQGISE